MLRKIQIVSVATVLVFSSLGFVTMASAQSSGAASPSGQMATPPLPTDSQDPSNPAGPNCYPDINHCASYPTGGLVKNTSSQSKQPQQPQQQQQQQK